MAKRRGGGGFSWGRVGVGLLLLAAVGHAQTTWTWRVTGTPLALRDHHTATRLADGRVLVVGGGSEPFAYATSEVFDPATGRWGAAAAMNADRVEAHTATRLLDGRVLVVGGASADYWGTRELASAEAYDPATNGWTPAPALAVSRQQHATVLLASGQVLVVGGVSAAAGAIASCERFDPATSTWAYSGWLRTARYGHAAVLLNDGRVLVAGGLDRSAARLASAELYDPGAQTWVAAPAMAMARGRPLATILGDGRVLVLGDAVDAEVYDPLNNAWQTVAGPAMGAAVGTASLTLDGTVVVTGGGGQPGDHSEVFAPASGTWLAGRPLHTSRWGHTATLLADGQVLVVGGGFGAERLGPGGGGGAVGEPATALTVTGYPSPAMANVPGWATVTAVDATGAVAAGYTGTVDVTWGGLGSERATFTAADAGRRVFLVTAGDPNDAADLQAFDTATWISGAQTGIQTVPGLLVATDPPTVTAGVTFTLTLTVVAAGGAPLRGYTGTVTLGGPPGLTLTHAFAAADASVYAFTGVTVPQAGAYLVTAGFGAGPGVGTSWAVPGLVVRGGAASTLLVAGFPSPIAAGAEADLTVTAVDAAGNRAVGYTGTVTFRDASGHSAAGLPANYAFTAADGGRHVFHGVSLAQPGLHSIVATDTATASITGSQTGIVVVPRLLLSATTATVTAGEAFDLTLTVADAQGHALADYTGAVSLTGPDGLALAHAFVAGDGAAHTFVGIRVLQGGDLVLTATFTAGPGAGTSLPLTGPRVVGGPAVRLVVSGFPAAVAAGSPADLTVAAVDSRGIPSGGYRGTVTFTDGSGAWDAGLPPNYPFVEADGGAHTFHGIYLRHAGPQAITATDTAAGSLTGTQAGITVTGGATRRLVLSGFPSPVSAGVPATFTVSAEDAYGNRAGDYAGRQVTFGSSDPRATLPEPYYFDGTEGGAKTFTATLRSPGEEGILSAEDNNVMGGPHTASQTGIHVTVGPPALLGVSGFPSRVSAGEDATFTVTPLDAGGNPTLGYTGTVAFTSTDPAADLPAATTFRADLASMTFTAHLSTAGTWSIAATDTLDPRITGTQAGIEVAPGAAALAVAGVPATMTSGELRVTVTATDAGGNRVTGYRGLVQFSTDCPGRHLPADYRFTADDAGSHTFSVALLTPGESSSLLPTHEPGLTRLRFSPEPWHLEVRDSAVGWAGAVTVIPGAEESFWVVPETEGVDEGLNLLFRVYAKDAFGSTVTNCDRSIRVRCTDPGPLIFMQAELNTGFEHSFPYTDQLDTTFTPWPEEGQVLNELQVAAFLGGEYETYRGYGEFLVQLWTPGRQQIEVVTRLGGHEVRGTADVRVWHGRATTLMAFASLDSVPAGSPFALNVWAYDSRGHLIDRDLALRFESSDPLAEWPADPRILVDDMGSRPFTVRLATLGPQTITVYAVGTALQANTGPVTVTAGVPVNAPPVAGDDALTAVLANSGLRTIAVADLLANDSPGPAEEAWQLLTLVGVGEGVGGTPAVVGTAVEFALTPGFTGQASFAYTIQDDGTTGGAPDPRTAIAHARFAVAHGSRLGLRLADAAGATIQALTLGEAEAVGLGFDPNWDTPADAPPASGLAARLLDTGVADPGKQWLTQRFRPRATTSRWRLVVSGLAGRGSPDLTWDVSGADAGREIYLQEIQDEQPVGLPLDMRTQSRLSVTRDAVYEIAYALRSTWRLPLRAGWNLVGNPVMSVQPLGAILGAGARAPGRVGAVWRWDGENYTAVADAAALAPEAGHWVEAAGDGESADIVGILADGITQLRPGWNLVAPVAACAFPAATGLAATAWVWDAAAQAYLPVGPGDTLAAGAGCWLYLDAARSVAVLLAP